MSAIAHTAGESLDQAFISLSALKQRRTQRLARILFVQTALTGNAPRRGLQHGFGRYPTRTCLRVYDLTALC